MKTLLIRSDPGFGWGLFFVWNLRSNMLIYTDNYEEGMDNLVDDIDIRLIDDLQFIVETTRKRHERRSRMDYSTEIRIEMIRHGLKQYELARRLGFSESYLSRLLRNGLSEERYEAIMAVIKEDE